TVYVVASLIILVLHKTTSTEINTLSLHDALPISNNYFVANFVGNPVIDNFNVKVNGGKITGSDFEINVDDLDKDRFKRDLTDGEYVLSVRPENILPVEEDGAVSAKVDDVEL